MSMPNFRKEMSRRSLNKSQSMDNISRQDIIYNKIDANQES